MPASARRARNGIIRPGDPTLGALLLSGGPDGGLNPLHQIGGSAQFALKAYIPTPKKRRFASGVPPHTGSRMVGHRKLSRRGLWTAFLEALVRGGLLTEVRHYIVTNLG
jgi:hypothetical protein